MVASTVSSKLLASMADKENFDFVDCLTGFKWIANTALDREGSGTHYTLFAYEEAIGFMCGIAVPDKDGISALATIAECAVFEYGKAHARDASGGSSGDGPETAYAPLMGLLRSCQQRYGYYASNNSYFICHDKDVIRRIFARIRTGGRPANAAASAPAKKSLGGLLRKADKQKVAKLLEDFDENNPSPATSSSHPASNTRPTLSDYITTCGAYKIAAVRDLTAPGFDSRTTDGAPTLPIQDSEMITFYFENGCVCTLRTSGTEPKIKYYTEMPGEFHTE